MPRWITHLVIHHAAGSSGNATTIKRHHVGANGWSDIGYHAVICNGRGGPDGELQAGRSEAKDGAGVYGNNRDKLHVCLIGQFASGEPGYTPPTAAQLRTLGKWLDSRSKTYGVSRVVGHKEITVAGHGTLCPGDLPLDRIRAWMAGDRQTTLDVALGMSQPKPARIVTVETRPLKAGEFKVDPQGDTWIKASALRPEFEVTWDPSIDTVRVRRGNAPEG